MVESIEKVESVKEVEWSIQGPNLRVSERNYFGELIIV